jgi:lactoylglutathione lyase
MSANRPMPPRASLVFLYYRDLARAQAFYADVLGLSLVVDQGFCKIFQIAPSSFVGLVDEAQGLHRAAEQKPVTLSFVVDDPDAWHAHLVAGGVPIHRPLADATRHPTRGFVAIDPEGYFLEFERFLDHEQNAALLEALSLLQS